MRPSAEAANAATARETLHELLNALAAARMWLVSLENAPQPPPALADSVQRLGLCLGNAEECCERLRHLLPEAARPRRR
jgi:hypothetical protein